MTKLNFIQIGFTILTVICTAKLFPEVVIPESIKNEIVGIIKTPQPSYRLDNDKKEELFSIIDAWFKKYIHEEKYEESKDNDEIIYIYKTTTNIPMFISYGVSGEGLKTGDFYIFYEKSPRNRIFRKDPDLPELETRFLMDKNTLIRLSSEFLKKRGFIKETTIDKVGRIQVLDYMMDKKSLEAGGKIDTFISYHSVIIHREVNGTPVLNSRQIINIYPGNREIIGYKNIEWIPLEETSEEYLSYLSYQEIRDIIEKYYSNSGEKTTLQAVRKYYYLYNDRLIPVIVTITDQKVNAEENGAPQIQLTISLLKDIRIE